jgi:N-acyl-D-amino-acid deacylase
MTSGTRPDLVIRGARLIDGSGAPARAGDLAVSDDRIVAVGDLRDVRGGFEIEARGSAIAPGFIDTHTHDDRALLVDPLMAFKVSQGVTTGVTGNCGISLAPLAFRGPVPRRWMCSAPTRAGSSRASTFTWRRSGGTRRP